MGKNHRNNPYNPKFLEFLEFFDEAGVARRLGKYEAGFFFERFSLKQFFYSIFVLKKLIQNSAAYPICLMFKGLFNKLAGKNPPLTRREVLEIWEGVIGIKPKTIRISSSETTVNMYAKSLHIYDIISVILRNQYHVYPKNIEKKVVIDAGANLGLFSIYAAKLGAKKVYAFEPVTETYIQLKRNITLNHFEKVVIPVNRALGIKRGVGKISYAYCGDCEASVELMDSSKKVQTVKITSIDEFMKKKERIDFIKIDTEGAEEKILLGAKKTIKRYKPALSFSAYHKSDDKIRLPQIVKQIRSDYVCTLHKRAEEDFYCE